MRLQTSPSVEQQVKQDFNKAKGLKHDQQINRTNAIATAMDVLTALLLKSKIKAALRAFDHIVYNTREIIRPNRSVPRKHNPKKLYASAYKKL